MESYTKFFLRTFGCRCNQADSAGMRTRLCGASLQETRNSSDADLIVVNTCTVTRRADQQARQAVRRLQRENPNATLVVTGCYAERDPETLAAIPGVDLVLGNADRNRLVELWHSRTEDGAKILRSPLDSDRHVLLPGELKTGGKTRPYLKLQDGCDARCSYCIVPSVRGRGRSADPEDVLAEIRCLVHQGYQEIVLTGVHLGSYGRRLPRPVRLPELLRRILEIPGLGRLRLSSIEPMGFDRAIVHLAAGNRSFAPHFHIPLQSGCNRILRRMRRPYTAERFLDLLEFIHSRLPDAGFGTDLLVGFPGETDEDFDATCAVVRRSPLTYLHVFPFSTREGTEACTMPDQVPPRVLQERCRILRQISGARNLEFRRRFLGQTLPAVSLAKEEELGESVALTDNYIHVSVAGSAVIPNRLIQVRIDEVRADRTLASIVSDR